MMFNSQQALKFDLFPLVPVQGRVYGTNLQGLACLELFTSNQHLTNSNPVNGSSFKHDC